MITIATIDAFKDGSEEAFELIYKEYANLVFYLCYKMTRNRSDAEDCVQETFIKVVKNIHTFNHHKASLGTWIYQIAKNQTLDFLKSKMRRINRVFINEEIVSLQKEEENIVDLTNIEILVGEQAYHILILKKGYMLTFEEIALELNISISKVKRIYYNAIEIIERSKQNEH